MNSSQAGKAHIYALEMSERGRKENDGILGGNDQITISPFSMQQNRSKGVESGDTLFFAISLKF